jgi:hypothetical protein
MPNFELQLVERLAGMEKLLKTQPSPSQPAHHLGEQIIPLFCSQLWRVSFLDPLRPLHPPKSPRIFFIFTLYNFSRVKKSIYFLAVSYGT